MYDFERQIKLEKLELLEKVYCEEEETLRTCLEMKQTDKKIMYRIKSMRETIDRIELLKNELDID